MARNTPFWKQLIVWTGIVGLAALAFWVVGVGAGWRGWILGPDGGIVAKAQLFGVEAYIWWIPATVLTATTAMMAIGLAIVRHLAEGPLGPVAALEPAPEGESFPELEPVPEKPSFDEASASAADVDDADADGAGESPVGTEPEGREASPVDPDEGDGSIPR